jgi:hypothetical protein
MDESDRVLSFNIKDSDIGDAMVEEGKVCLSPVKSKSGVVNAQITVSGSSSKKKKKNKNKKKISDFEKLTEEARRLADVPNEMKPYYYKSPQSLD